MKDSRGRWGTGAVVPATAGLLLAPLLVPVAAAAPTVRLVSVTSSEEQVEGSSTAPAISGDGRRVVFQSLSDALTPLDQNGVADVFVRNVDRGTTRLVSVGLGGTAANGPSRDASISRDGRFVTFTSAASNLVPHDLNGVDDVFRRDLVAKRTLRVSRGLPGLAADRAVSTSSVSADGSKVSFSVVSGGRSEIYVRDVDGRTTRLVSAARDGGAADGSSFLASISASGRYVAFLSIAENLVTADSNGVSDVFRRDLVRDRTVLVSRDVAGGASNGQALGGAPAISPRGRYVAFHSEATDLVRADVNGEPDVFVRNLGTRRTHLVSVTSDGAQVTGFGSFHTVGMAVAAGGRLIAFSSDFSGLTADDHNGTPDVFVRNRLLGTTTRVSSGTGDRGPSGFSTHPDLSEDGRFVTFTSDAPDLVTPDANGGEADVFLSRVPG